MIYSQVAVTLVQRFEGLRLSTYSDVVGNKTIGWGHKEPSDAPDRTITDDEALELLRLDLNAVCLEVLRLVKINLHQYELDALCDLVFNIGSGDFGKSEMLVLLNQYNVTRAADEFGKWVYADGQKLPGLVTRRLVEKSVFLNQNEHDTVLL